ncbi:hypothetical protein [Endozoicomonas euniceicola]|uniref:Uncharacterized protein n=1 Tax=Endozoicomonas euniceicola TaxID=1234143 RepID=A0ABY6GZN1_9GAMM|nr:hypothetical protein [Endozoicomonas euniceicola]UYM18246.1 hypothetical protein NX720_10185 [Endozoicomonas euniceicola]
MDSTRTKAYGIHRELLTVRGAPFSTTAVFAGTMMLVYLSAHALF